VFERNAEEVNVVSHNPRILALFRCHHCSEVIHSDQCVGYVLKYCSKNSDEGQVFLEKVMYEGREINRSRRLEYFAATRVCSACECFAAISGYWRHHLQPAVVLLDIHLPGKKVVLAFDTCEDEAKVDLPSRLERYFGRALGDDFERLTYPESSGSQVLSPQGDAGSGHRDLCNPSYFVNRRKNSVLAVLNSVSIRCLELFALPMLLVRYPARSCDGLRTCEGIVLDDFTAMVKAFGLIADVDDEARIAMQDAVDLNPPRADLRFLLVQLASYVSNADDLECHF
jgi:hypothetical protein